MKSGNLLTLLIIHTLINLFSLASTYDLMGFGMSADEIKNCQFNPYVCALLCGSANPSCSMTGHCSCYHRPSSDCNCLPPTIFNMDKCNRALCQRKGTVAAVCTANKEKYCVCAPSEIIDQNSTITQAFTERKFKRFSLP